MSKVFLSYIDSEFEVVKVLYDRLRASGIDCLFDRESAAWGRDRVIGLEKAAAECDLIIVVLSRAYLKFKWPGFEQTCLQSVNATLLRRKIRLFLLEDLRDVLPVFFKSVPWINVSTPQKLAREYPKICRELGGEPESAQPEKQHRRARNRSSTPLKRLRTIPRAIKPEFGRRLGDQWSDLVRTLGIPASDQAGFRKGLEAQYILEWLEGRKWLYRLPKALAETGRHDLKELLLNPG